MNHFKCRLMWSEPTKGTKEIPYDHVTAETPFGRILITWKGWKDNPYCCIDEHPVDGAAFTQHDGDLADAKETAERLFFGAISKTIPDVNLDALDAARYRWLMKKRVMMAPASMDGPEFPSLNFSADIWNSRPHESPQVRITEKIDAAIAAEKEQANGQ